jgi:hypothetical protein
MNELALFAGAGGGILAGKLLGWRTVCAVEINSFCADRLMQRQNEGILPAFPIWDDVRTFDGIPWGGIVDVVSGGFPCTDISPAGKKSGIGGDSSGLWRQMARIIGEVRPRYASWKTRQLSLIEDSELCLETWPKWGFLHDGECWDQTMLAPPTPGRDAGSWPTPCHGSSHWGGTFQEVGGSQNKLRGTPIGKMYVNPDFWESLMGWPIGWTGIAPLETAKIQEWQQQHSTYFQPKPATTSIELAEEL